MFPTFSNFLIFLYTGQNLWLFKVQNYFACTFCGQILIHNVQINIFPRLSKLGMPAQQNFRKFKCWVSPAEWWFRLIGYVLFEQVPFCNFLRILEHQITAKVPLSEPWTNILSIYTSNMLLTGGLNSELCCVWSGVNGSTNW